MSARLCFLSSYVDFCLCTFHLLFVHLSSSVCSSVVFCLFTIIFCPFICHLPSVHLSALSIHSSSSVCSHLSFCVCSSVFFCLFTSFILCLFICLLLSVHICYFVSVHLSSSVCSSVIFCLFICLNWIVKYIKYKIKGSTTDFFFFNEANIC